MSDIIDLTSPSHCLSIDLTAPSHCLSIDIGSKNMAISCCDLATQTFTKIWRVSYPTGVNEFMPKQVAHFLLGFIRREVLTFVPAYGVDVLIEKQIPFMRSSFGVNPAALMAQNKACVVNTIAESVLHSIFLSLGMATVTMDPNDGAQFARAIFHIPARAEKKCRAEKKRNVLQLMKYAMAGDSRFRFGNGASAVIAESAKKDDIADSFAQLAAYYCRNEQSEINLSFI
jgi:hypothetical protein